MARTLHPEAEAANVWRFLLDCKKGKEGLIAER